jgi:colanic acid/amylovoran biosynthesis glycosyltransferase
MRVAYLVSRFPHVSETFIVRELTAVARQGVDVTLLSLFPPVDPTVHPAARPWLAVVHRPRPPAALAALGWWARRRPLRLAGAVLRATGGYVRRPALLVRALVTLALGAAHARRLVEGRIDHVHAHYATYPLLAAWLCHRLTGTTYSFTAHAHDLFVDQSFLRTRVSEARFAVAISEYNRRFLLSHTDGRTPIHVVHCGVDPTAYRYRPRAPSTGHARALCVASLQEYKGHEVLLRALADGGPQLARLELDLVGSGPLRGDLERLAGALALASRVRFHGALSEPEVAQLLDRADCAVLASIVGSNGQMEGIPVALMEALAAGVPVVATRLSGVPELIRDGETGLLAEPGSVADLRCALRALLADPAGALARAEAGRRLVEAEYDVRASAARLAALLRDCGARHGRVRPR